MKPTQIIQALPQLLNTPHSPFIWGDPGIGKSDIIREVAAQLKIGLTDLRLSIYDPTDLKGFPTIVGTGKSQGMHFVPPALLPTKGKGIMYGFLFVTMLFSGGIVPTYMVMNTLGLTGSRLSIILLEATQTFYLIFAAKAFAAVPLSTVEAARIENGTGETAGGIPMGEGFAVKLRVRARQPVENIMAAVAIADAMGTRLCGINSRDVAGATWSLGAGELLEVVCRVPRMNLLPGAYSVNVGLQRAASREPLDFIAGALTLEVLPKDVFGTGKMPQGPGNIYLESEWAATGAEPAAGWGTEG